MMFDRNALKLLPLSEREHDLHTSIMKNLEPIRETRVDKSFQKVAERIIVAKKKNRSVILLIGGHVIRSGVQKYIIDLMENGYISCLSMNGAGVIHDFEFALIGATTESVAKYIKKGQFGLWKETGIINDIVNKSFNEDKSEGFGNVIGMTIAGGNYPYAEYSLLAAAHRLNIQTTVHVGIGHDIIHEHPNFNGAATGALSYNDFLKFASQIQNLEEGVVMNFGSAVMAPEVFLKALSMARNVACQKDKEISRFTTLVCDLHDLPNDFRSEPSKTSPAYYYRPWKTMLVRTVADGGESFYIKGHHEQTIPSLWTSLK